MPVSGLDKVPDAEVKLCEALKAVRVRDGVVVDGAGEPRRPPLFSR